MIIKHKTQRQYQYGGNGIFDILTKVASTVARKKPEMIAKAQANNSIDKVTKKVVKQGEKALIDNSGKLAKATVRKVVDTIYRKKPPTDVIAKQMATDLINSLPPKKTLTSSTNLNSLISGMGLKPLSVGSGIILD